MNQICVDSAFERSWRTLRGPLNCVIPRAKRSGFALPPDQHERLRKLEEDERRLMYADAQKLFTNEELDEDEKETETVSTDELIRHLESL